MKAISRPLISQFQRAFGIRGGADIALAEEIIPTALVADLEQHPYANRGGSSWGEIAPAVAAQYAQVLIQNPPTSSCVAVVWATDVRANSASQLGLFIGDGAVNVLPGITPSIFVTPRDTRRIQTSGSVGQVKGGNGSTGGAISSAWRIGVVYQAAAASQQVPFLGKPGVPVAILAPGGWLAWQHSVVNEILSANFSWDEYEIL